MVHFFKILNKAFKSDIKYVYTVAIKSIKKDEPGRVSDLISFYWHCGKKKALGIAKII